MTQFFIAFDPPTITHQQHKVTTRGGKPRFYEPAELKDARSSLESRLARFAPATPYTTGVRLTTRWCFPVSGKHEDGEYRTSRPDVTNLQKMLEDVMTDLGYWKDDALIVSTLVEKFWADIPGLFIRIEDITQ